MVPSIYNAKTHKINYLNWNQDSFATCTNYNPDTQELIIPHYSMSLSYKLTDDYNNGIIKNILCFLYLAAWFNEKRNDESVLPAPVGISSLNIPLLLC